MIVGDHCVKESMGVGLRVRGVEGIGDEMQLGKGAGSHHRSELV